MRVEPRRQHVGAGGQRRGGLGGERPLALGGDADRRDAVLGRIGGGQHVGRGGAADVVFGGLPAEQDHEVDSVVDPLGAHPPDGTVAGREVAGIPGGGRGRWRARRTRRRRSTAPRSTRGRSQPGQLFVPLVADRDGHDFIAAALAAGAAAYLTAGASRVAASAIVVADTAAALMELAAWARLRFADVPVVGVTGSVGKTSTKDLIAAALGATRRVTANERSFNNEQGLPVTILGAPDDVRGTRARDGHARVRRDHPAV